MNTYAITKTKEGTDGCAYAQHHYKTITDEIHRLLHVAVDHRNKSVLHYTNGSCGNPLGCDFNTEFHMMAAKNFAVQAFEYAARHNLRIRIEETEEEYVFRIEEGF